jgi:hypothetical protein
MALRESGGVHFIEIEVSGMAAFESVPPQTQMPVRIPTKRNALYSQSNCPDLKTDRRLVEMIAFRIKSIGNGLIGHWLL